ncbi:uncharacterized protein A1O9_09539 [Exophiala aquamarina CBS 119918]|uniref:Alcohol dehydrogenase n=1 Tax=Exophiala aquamarina CBS 119918 TaxID=1182545 RepID=A0A072P530_9EURO|nr:uncharacterized protein A1O9_09539 [Exophiala aquamarina CBS 119918]KEF54373.1 hypothetical protein A1O9_09539 [Exophiala aquamarina CBS 119918]
MEFGNKIVIVTGAARGIGQAAAREYARQGARVVLADINMTEQQTTASQLRASGYEANAYKVDISKDEEVHQFATWVTENIGIPDLIHNNAVMLRSGGILDIEIEDIQELMNVNVFGYLRVVRAFLPAMLERGSGHIAVTASPNGINPQPMVSANLAAYCLCKAADVSLAQCLAVSLKPLGLSVSLLFPNISYTESVEELSGKAPAEFHQGLAQVMMAHGTSPETNAKMLIEGLKEGKFFVNAHPGYELVLREWVSHDLDPLVDWVDTQAT